MKQLIINPNGWPCTLEECPPGPFVDLKYNTLCFKSEYHSENGKPEAYNSAGEFYHGDGLVQPVIAEWDDVEP